MTGRLLSSQPGTAELVRFIEASRAAFENAASRAGGAEDFYFLIAGFCVRLRFAGPALKSHMVRALAHNAAPASEHPSLVIYLWDRASTGTALPPVPWRHDGHVRRGEIEGLRSDRVHVAIEAGSGGVSLFDDQTNEAIYFTPDADGVPYYDSAAPLRSILNAWLTRHGLQLVHAGAIGGKNGGILLAGKGGSGKSTTALLCLEAGMSYASDDYSVLSLNPIPYVHSLYNSAKIRPEDVARFPRLFGAAQHNISDEKKHIFIQEHLPGSVSTGFPVRALLLPRVVGHGPTIMKPASAASSLMALAPSTIFQLPGAGGAAFELLARFVRAVPAYILELGGSTEDVPRVIREFLA